MPFVMAVGEGENTDNLNPPWVWRSADLGLTWTHIPPADIAALTLDADHVYICGSVLDLGNNRVVLNLGGTTALDDPPFRLSTDAGLTFSVQTHFAAGQNHGGNGGQCFQMVVADDGSILAPTRYGSGGQFQIWRGVPQGTPITDIEWSRVLLVAEGFGTNSPECGVCRIGPATFLAYVQGATFGSVNNKFYRSIDNGQTWAEVASISGQFFSGRLISPATNVALLGVEGIGTTPWRIYRTTDGGETWAVVYTLPNPGAASIHSPFSATIGANNRCFIAGFFNSNDVPPGLHDLIRSDDDGITWGNEVDIREFVNWNGVRALGYLGASTLIAGSLHSGDLETSRLSRSTDNGATWVANADRLPGPIFIGDNLEVHDFALVADVDLCAVEVVAESQELLLGLGDETFMSARYHQVLADVARATGIFITTEIVRQVSLQSTYRVSSLPATAQRCLELLAVHCFPSELEPETLDSLANWDASWWSTTSPSSEVGSIVGQDTIESVSQAMFLTVLPMGVAQGDMVQAAGLFRGISFADHLFDNPTHWTKDVRDVTQFLVYPAPLNYGVSSPTKTYQGVGATIPTDNFVTIFRQVPACDDIPDWLKGLLAYRLAAAEARRLGETSDVPLADALDQLSQVIETAIVAQFAGAR